MLHHPSTGSIQMSLHVVTDAGTVDTIVDTGTLYDNTCRGGRIGKTKSN